MTHSSNFAQRCDAKRPCTTCFLANKASSCIYDDGGDPQLKGLVLSRNTDGPLSGQHLRGPDPVKTPTILSTFPPVPTTFASDAARTTTPEPQITLSFPGEMSPIRLSVTEAADLDLRLCVLEYKHFIANSPSDISRLWVLPRLPKLGVQLSHKRLDAFICGDQSDTVLNRAFVCGAHVLGMLFSADINHSPAMVRLHARRSQIAWECLADLFKSENYVVTVQVVTKVAAAYILIRMVHTSNFYIHKCCEVIKVGKLSFIPTCGRLPELSEDLHETLVALSQTIYWSNYLFLMCGGPEPHATAQLEKEFRQELPVSTFATVLSRIRLTFHSRGLFRFSSKSAP